MKGFRNAGRPSSRRRQGFARPRERASPVSEPTVRRLSHYYRVLDEVAAEGKRMISSRLLAEREGVTSAQVRKDLSCFGSFGRRGLGYNVSHLRAEIRAILGLGLGRRWRVVVVGAGHIGAALIAYPGFREQGFDVMAVFDRDPGRIGRRAGGLVVEDVARLEAACDAGAFDIGVIATPASAAQEVASALVAGGLRGILNFAPRKVSVPSNVLVRNVDLRLEFESLSFGLGQPSTARRRRARD